MRDKNSFRESKAEIVKTLNQRLLQTKSRRKEEGGKEGGEDTYHNPHALIIVHRPPNFNLPLLINSILARKRDN